MGAEIQSASRRRREPSGPLCRGHGRAPGRALRAEPTHRAPDRPHTKDCRCPAPPAVQGGVPEMRHPWAGVYQGLSKPLVPAGTFPKCLGMGQTGCLRPTRPRTPCPGGAAEAWRGGPACQRRHLPLVSQVCFVAHKHDDDIAAPLRPDVINPLRGLLEGVEVCRWKVGIKLGVRSSSWQEKIKEGQGVRPGAGGQAHRPHRLVRLGLPQKVHMCVWSCCPGALESPLHC